MDAVGFGHDRGDVVGVVGLVDGDSEGSGPAEGGVGLGSSGPQVSEETGSVGVHGQASVGCSGAITQCRVSP